MKFDNDGPPAWFVCWAAFCILSSIAWTVFVVWVIVKIMQHFGVI